MEAEEEEGQMHLLVQEEGEGSYPQLSQEEAMAGGLEQQLEEEHKLLTYLRHPALFQLQVQVLEDQPRSRNLPQELKKAPTSD